MKVMTRIVGGAVMLAAALAGSMALAGKDPDCVQACQEQYMLEKKACLEAFQAQEDAVNQQRACCVDPTCWQGEWRTPTECLQGAQRTHVANVRAKNACFAEAHRRARLCRDACPDISPIAP